MKNNGLFSSIFIEDLRKSVTLDDAAEGRMATLAQTWRARNAQDTESIWESFLKQALGYLEFVPPGRPDAPGVYPLYEDWSFGKCVSVLYLAPPGSDIDDTAVGRFYPAKLIANLQERKLNWGILTDGSCWRLYSTKSSRPYEDYVELQLAQTLEGSDEAEYGLFERFFHRDSFVADQSSEASADAEIGEDTGEISRDKSAGMYKCRLDHDRDQSEQALDKSVKKPFLAQIDEVLQYICNGFIFDTQKSGEEYTEEERAEIFESAVKLIYRCLFLFYAEARRLLPTDPDKADLYRRHSIQAICKDAHNFQWGHRRDTNEYDLWKHLKGLINAVNDGDPEYGIMGYNGGLFDDEEERFLGQHQLRNDFLSRALYLLAFVEPLDNGPDGEYAIPYEDLEVRHLGELYENILEFTVQLADADRIRRRTKKGVEMLMASQTTKKAGDTFIKKGDVYFGESALERKQTGSYYTPESLVRFLNQKTIVQPLSDIFEEKYRQRFHDLLEQASKGQDIGTRRGAAQSAAALVDRFAEEEVLHFKVCDPAMGSGHFLVDASNQMTGLVIALLAEVPDVEGMTVSVTSSSNDWRRRITRHCLYGVDLNLLAVNLAKLSLWLNCFATHHRLTFLDHHLRCGNSLIGIRSLKQLTSIPERKKESKKKNNQQRLLFDYNDLSGVLAETAKAVANITRIDEDDTDSQKAVLEEALLKASRLRPLADLYTAYLMDPNIPAGDYKEIFERLAKGQSLYDSFHLALPKTLESVEDHRDWHHFYHWPLEFPDVFGPGEEAGFNATVGNPPWDVLQPNTQEFYFDYDPNFRKYNKQEALSIIKQLHQGHPHIAQKWNDYEAGFQEASIYFKEPAACSCLHKGKIDLYKAFLERFFSILKNDGRMGIIVPSGIYTDQGCLPIRELFLSQSQIEFLYCFENRRAVFNIHRSFKFVLFSTKKGGSTDRFKCAFMEHEPERLPVIDADALLSSVQDVYQFSPQSKSILELRNSLELQIFRKLCAHGHIGNHPRVRYSREFNLTTDRDLFIDKSNSDYELYEGKHINQFDSEFEERTMGLLKEQVHKVFSKAARSIPPDLYRLALREVAASTNERTSISTILPKKVCHTYTLCSLTAIQCLGLFDNSILNKEIALLVAVGHTNSFCFDFFIRRKITNHLSTPFYEFPAPPSTTQHNYSAIASRSALLICITENYSELWNAAYSTPWQSADFWYPSSTPIDTYGPAHEQEIRLRLREEAKNLTPEWGHHCGVHDRLPDRRDTGDRAQLRAEIDAYVAHLYGLSRNHFAYILDTFPVLKKKEEKAFGEFMSKRKCLEEYDRLMPIVEGMK